MPCLNPYLILINSISQSLIKDHTTGSVEFAFSTAWWVSSASTHNMRRFSIQQCRIGVLGGGPTPDVCNGCLRFGCAELNQHRHHFSGTVSVGCLLYAGAQAPLRNASSAHPRMTLQSPKMHTFLPGMASASTSPDSRPATQPRVQVWGMSNYMSIIKCLSYGFFCRILANEYKNYKICILNRQIKLHINEIWRTFFLHANMYTFVAFCG